MYKKIKLVKYMKKKLQSQIFNKYLYYNKLSVKLITNKEKWVSVY